jgi:hypothetical protein
MKRREIIVIVSDVVVAWPLAFHPQQSAKTWRVGQVVGGTPLARADEVIE